MKKIYFLSAQILATLTLLIGLSSRAFADQINAVNAAVTAKETIAAKPLIAAAYGFMWLVVFLFVVFTYLRSRKVEQEIADVKKQLEKNSGA